MILYQFTTDRKFIRKFTLFVTYRKYIGKALFGEKIRLFADGPFGRTFSVDKIDPTKVIRRRVFMYANRRKGL